ncbi:MAG: hypothetical protein HFH28_03640 [Clostridiaceae bacterium]|nr:hypothetical protein [Clostridiaceae bacterium]
MVFGVVIDRSLLESPLANAPQIYGYTLLITEFGTEIVALALRHGFHRVIMLPDSAIELYEICLPHTNILCSFALFVYTFLLLIRIKGFRIAMRKMAIALHGGAETQNKFSEKHCR